MKLKLPSQNTWGFLLGLGLFYTLIFITTRAAPYLGGDEVFLTSPLGSHHDRGIGEFSYLSLVRERYFLVFSLRRVFDFFNHDLRFSLFFFQTIFATSALLLFFILKKFFSIKASILAALLFLSYVGKYEILHRFEGGFYHVVIMLLAISMWILFSKLFSYPLKMLLIGFIFWTSFHFYEILISITPFFPFLFLIENRIKKVSLINRNFVFSFIPLIVAFLHLLILSSAENPIWNRNTPTDSNSLEKVFFIFKVFYMSMSTLLGQRFIGWTGSGLYSFLRVELISNPALIFLLLACSAYLYKVVTKPESSSKNPIHIKPFVIWATFLVFITPLIALPVAKYFVPSRFTYISSFMLAFPIAYSIDYFFVKIKTWALWTVAVLILIQSTALSGINAQHRWAGQLDQKIEEALLSSQIELKNNEALFVSIPFDNQEKHYRKHTIVTGQYVDKAWAETLWGHFPHLIKAPVYQAHIRREEWAWKGFLSFIDNWKKEHPEQTLKFVYLDEFYRPWIPIKVDYLKDNVVIWNYNSKESMAKNLYPLEHKQGSYKMRVYFLHPLKELKKARSLYQ